MLITQITKMLYEIIIGLITTRLMLLIHKIKILTKSVSELKSQNALRSPKFFKFFNFFYRIVDKICSINYYLIIDNL